MKDKPQKTKRTRTLVTRLQAKERGHDFDVQGYKWIRNGGQTHTRGQTRAHKRSHSESSPTSHRESHKG